MLAIVLISPKCFLWRVNVLLVSILSWKFDPHLECSSPEGRGSSLTSSDGNTPTLFSYTHFCSLTICHSIVMKSHPLDSRHSWCWGNDSPSLAHALQCAAILLGSSSQWQRPVHQAVHSMLAAATSPALRGPLVRKRGSVFSGRSRLASGLGGGEAISMQSWALCLVLLGETWPPACCCVWLCPFVTHDSIPHAPLPRAVNFQNSEDLF